MPNQPLPKIPPYLGRDVKLQYIYEIIAVAESLKYVTNKFRVDHEDVNDSQDK